MTRGLYDVTFRGKLVAEFPLVVWLVTFGVAIPVMCVILQLNNSLYYQCYVWLVHHYAASDIIAAEDGRLVAKLMVENERRVTATNSYLEDQLSKRDSGNSKNCDHGDGDKIADQMTLRPCDLNAKVIVMVTLISSPRAAFIPGDGEHDGFKFTPNYLVQNAARFLQLINGRNPQIHHLSIKYHLTVCSVGENPTPEEAYLAQLIPVVRKPEASNDVDSESDRFGSTYDRLAWRYEKEKRDYLYCLRETVQQYEMLYQGNHRKQSMYLLLVEDDALPKNEALSVIDRLVSGHWTSRTERELNFAKLFHPNHLHGYLSIEVERLPQLVSTALVFGTLLYLVRCRHQSVAARPPSLAGSCFFVGLMALAVGRVHFDRWRTSLAPYAHYMVPDNLCCTQALLFERRTAVTLADYLDMIRCNETFHKDEALWTFQHSSTEGASRGVLVQPNLFEHVGLFSGLRNGFVDPHILISS